EAHSLKGAATSVGAMALGQAAALIELAPDLPAMAAALPTLDRQVTRTRQAVEALVPRGFPARDIGRI
ncbi:MAG: Hpt domain-containing protein, partial [Sphingomicrobium sp.]